MFRSSLVLLAVAAQLAVTSPAAAQSSPDLGAMLEQAQRFTVKVRGTALWPFAPEQMGTGLGTGFIIDRDKGWILTNAHVAKRSPSTVEIALGESETEWLPVQRIYVDNHLDIAVLKVATDKLPADAMAAKLGCTQTVKQGATVVAYGHPISLNFTATRGIVSSVRTLNSHEFVQMDANINPGNSGGPLLAADVAEVIGVNTANISGAPGLGLALAIRHVCPVLDLLAKGADPSLPGLPVYWLKRGQVETLTVAAAFPRSSADKSGTEDGLKPGDIVQGIVGGPKLASLPELNTALRGRQGQVTLEVVRDGKGQTVNVSLIPALAPLKRQGLTFSGLLVTERINLDTADSNLPPLRIEFIKNGEAAARVGLRPGDQLDSVGGQRFTTVAALHDWLKGRPSAERVPVLVRRFSNADTRVTAEYHRFEIQPTDLHLLKADE
ncbi:MAG TPA: trypsin-like peptidase domain-containing protein [Xanthobacteraceae bacterium]|jgi:S1-C subfamily serine protease|nr:trypsin-like peptidase domain-containing protein [Xanthobacteraceae bacterium]